MEVLVVFCLTLFSVASGVVGIRLLLLARHTGEVPERLVGTAYLSASALGYPLLIVATSLAKTHPDLGRLVHAAAIIGLQLGISCLLFFNARVFRPGVAWATAAATVGAGILVLCGIGTISIWPPTPELMARARAFGLGTVGVLGVGYGWIAVEGFLYHARMRRRMAIGLADPVLTNRFLLWATMGTVASISNLLNFVYLAAGRNILQEPLTVLVTSLNGVSNAILLFLIFMPPAWYLRSFTSARQGAVAGA